MNAIKKMKVKNDYAKVERRIGEMNNYASLKTLANNIRKRVKDDADYKHFNELADKAEHKANVVRILEKCPSPTNNTLLEQIAFNNFVEGCASLNRLPSVRVIHQQLKKLGYANTMVRQVEKEVGNTVFLEMASKGILKNTSEYFVYKYGKHLANPKTYKKVADLFRSNEELQMVA